MARERIVNCAYPGCEVELATRSPRGIVYCRKHRKQKQLENSKSYKERRKLRGGKILDPLERGRPEQFTVHGENWYPEGCIMDKLSVKCMLKMGHFQPGDIVSDGETQKIVRGAIGYKQQLELIS